MDASPHTTVVFFSSHKLPKTVTVTTLLQRIGAGSPRANGIVNGAY